MILAIFFLFFLIPTDAFAWGPATHLEYASHALQHLALFSVATRKILEKYKDHFLYGSIAADITLGKNARGYLYNCHNWKVAFDLFHKKAKKDSQKAFMLGYMGHLAADTVAHNYFVPFKLIRSWKTKLLKHVYWEMRMDLSVPGKHWDTMEALAGHDYSEDDALLEGHLKRTIFSFKTNKKIFNSLIILQRMEKYKKLALNIADKSVWVLDDKAIRNYKKIANNSVIDFLKNLEESYCLQADPTGKLKMLYARDIIKNLRLADKQDELSPQLEDLILKKIKSQMEKGIYEVVTLPRVEDFVS